MTKEVDDVDYLTCTPASRLTSTPSLHGLRLVVAPMPAAHATGLSSAGLLAAAANFIDVPGSPPRGAPV